MRIDIPQYILKTIFISSSTVRYEMKRYAITTTILIDGDLITKIFKSPRCRSVIDYRNYLSHCLYSPAMINCADHADHLNRFYLDDIEISENEWINEIYRRLNMRRNIFNRISGRIFK